MGGSRRPRCSRPCGATASRAGARSGRPRTRRPSGPRSARSTSSRARPTTPPPGCGTTASSTPTTPGGCWAWALAGGGARAGARARLRSLQDVTGMRTLLDRQPRRDRPAGDPHVPRARGIRTVAVYSDADRGGPARARGRRRGAPSVRRRPPSRYLSIERILDAARSSGADAIHPGYGFLSERAEFARAVVEAGLTFVGPPRRRRWTRWARKDRAARDRRAGRGPGRAAVSRRLEPDGLGRRSAAARLPGAGEGRRGWRRQGHAHRARPPPTWTARSPQPGVRPRPLRRRHPPRRAATSSAAATSRSRSSPTQHGNVVHLFERDCSAQRRHQKVLEEAPAPGLSDAARTTLLRRRPWRWRGAVGYANAGTVEFLVAGEQGRAGLLPRDEHPAPGRAPGHRAGRRPAPLDLVRPAAARGRGRAAGLRPGRRPLRGPRHRGAGLRRGRRSAGSCPRPAPRRSSRWPTSGPGRRRPRDRADRHHRPTTPCSARSSLRRDREARPAALVAALDGPPCSG